MGMKRKVLKAASYAAAPKLTMLANHAGKAAWMKAGGMALERMMPERLRPRPKRSAMGMAARGLGAAAVAAPIGWWLGRKMNG